MSLLSCLLLAINLCSFLLYAHATNSTEVLCHHNGFELDVREHQANKVYIPPVDTAEVTAVDPPYPLTSRHRSIMARHLTPELYTKLSARVTSSGFTIDNAIARGVNKVHVQIGLLAGDEESFEAFREIFEPVIHEFHGGPELPSIDVEEVERIKMELTASRQLSQEVKSGMQHSVEHSDSLNSTKDLASRILSVRIRAARNIRGYDFSPKIAPARREELSWTLRTVLDNITMDARGVNSSMEKTESCYFNLTELPESEIQSLVDGHLLFQRPHGPDEFSGYDGTPESWPIGRGLWLHSNSGNPVQSSLSVWVNEEDHMRVIALRKGDSDLEDLLADWQHFMGGVERTLNRQGHEFANHEKFGYLSSCPSNVGTGMRASVMIDLKHLVLKEVRLIGSLLGLVIRNEGGERVVQRTQGSTIYEISNKRRWGWSEMELVLSVKKCVSLLMSIDEVKAMDEAKVAALINILHTHDIALKRNETRNNLVNMERAHGSKP